MQHSTLYLTMLGLGIAAWVILLLATRRRGSEPGRQRKALLIGALIGATPLLGRLFPNDTVQHLFLRCLAAASALLLVGFWLLRRREDVVAPHANVSNGVSDKAHWTQLDQQAFDAGFDEIMGISTDDPRANMPDSEDWVERQPDPESFLADFAQDVLPAETAETSGAQHALHDIPTLNPQIYDAAELEQDSRLRMQQAKVQAQGIDGAIARLESRVTELSQRHEQNMAQLHAQQLALDERTLRQRQQLRTNGAADSENAQQTVIDTQQTLLQQRRNRVAQLELQLSQQLEENKRLNDSLKRARQASRESMLLARQAVTAQRLARLQMQREQAARRMHQKASGTAIGIARRAVQSLQLLE